MKTRGMQVLATVITVGLLSVAPIAERQATGEASGAGEVEWVDQALAPSPNAGELCDPQSIGIDVAVFDEVHLQHAVLDAPRQSGTSDTATAEDSEGSLRTPLEPISPPSSQKRCPFIARFSDTTAALIPVGATGPNSVDSIAAVLVGLVGGELEFTYDYTIRGFSAILTDTQAAQLRSRPELGSVRLAAEAGEAFGVQDVSPHAGLWGLDRIDQRDYPLDGLFHYGPTGHGLDVYVIDSGVNPNAEFGDRLQPGHAVAGNAAQEDCGPHGSSVALAIGGSDVGVAKRVQLHPVNFTTVRGGETIIDCWNPASNAIAALEWVNEDFELRGLTRAVVNLSQGWDASDDLDAAVEATVARGLVVVVAAGNAGENACTWSPARVSTAITVGAISQGAGDNTAAWGTLGASNAGSCIDIWAPGSGVVGGNGTSFAAPLVAGVAALMWQSDPTMTPAELMTEMINASTKNRMSPSVDTNRILYWDSSSFLRCMAPVQWWDGTVTVGVEADDLCELRTFPDFEPFVQDGAFFAPACPPGMNPLAGSDCGLIFTVPNMAETIMLDDEVGLRFYIVPHEFPWGTATPSCPDGFDRTVHIGDVAQCDGELAAGYEAADYSLIQIENTATLVLANGSSCMIEFAQAAGCWLADVPEFTFGVVEGNTVLYGE